MEKVYYGSQNGEIEEITSVKNASGKDVIYATDNEIMALILSNPGKGDLDTVRVVLGGKPILVERRAGVLLLLFLRQFGKEFHKLLVVIGVVIEIVEIHCSALLSSL